MSEAQSYAGPGGPDSVPAAGKLTTQSPINVTLPDSLRNMVFVQAASCWLFACLGALGLIWGGLSLLNEGRSEEAVAGVVVGLVVTFLAGAGLLVLHYGVWRPALRGRYAAIVALYVFHVLFLLVAPLVAVMAVFVIGDVLVSGFALMAGLIVLGIITTERFPASPPCRTDRWLCRCGVIPTQRSRQGWSHHRQAVSRR